MIKKVFLIFLVQVVFLQASFGQNAQEFKTSIEVLGADEYITIDRYTGRSKDVVIPATIGGLPVKSIGENSFEFKGLTSVFIPEGVEVILSKAFFGNQLENVEIPSTIEIISDSAFDSNVLLRVRDAYKISSNRNSQWEETEYFYPAGELRLGSNGSDLGYDEEPWEQAVATKIVLQQGDSRIVFSKNVNKNAYDPLAGYDPLANYAPSNKRLTAPAPSTQIIPAPAYRHKKVEKQIEKQIEAEKQTQEVIESPVSNNSPKVEKQVRGEPQRQVSKRPAPVDYTIAKNLQAKPDLPAKRGDAIVTRLSRRAELSSEERSAVIERLAFSNKGLNSAVIPEGTVYIEDGAFMLNSISIVDIPESVRYIGWQAFIGNPIVSITIGDNVALKPDSFRYQFSDYYAMAGFRAGTYIWKSGQWDLNGIERVEYNTRNR